MSASSSNSHIASSQADATERRLNVELSAAEWCPKWARDPPSAGDALLGACIRGLPMAARALLRRGADPNRVPFDSSTRSSLNAAIFQGRPEVVQVLLECGADANGDGAENSKEGGESSPLLVAASHGELEAARLLLGHGASLDAKDSKGRGPLARACAAASVDVALLLLERIRHVDAGHTETDGPALHRAAQAGQLAEVRRLAALGSSPSALWETDRRGATPLHAACRRPGNAEVVRYLLGRWAAAGVSADGPDGRGMSALHWVAACGDVAMASALLERGPGPRAASRPGGRLFWSALDVASACGRADMVCRLLEARGGVFGGSALFFVLAAAGGHVPVLEAALERGFDVNQKVRVRADLDADETALHVAASFGQLDAVRFLLQWGANVHGSSGSTPLQRAVMGGREEVARLLSQRGAREGLSTESAWNRGMFIFHLQRADVPSVRAYLECGVCPCLDSPDLRWELTQVLERLTLSGQFPVARLVLEHCADAQTVLLSCRGVLVRAACVGDLEAMEWLVGRGLDCNCADRELRWTPLSAAAACALGGVDALEWLLGHGAAVDATDLDGDTAVAAAARRGRLAEVQYLVGRGARTDCGARPAIAEAAKAGLRVRTQYGAAARRVVEFLLPLASLDELLVTRKARLRAVEERIDEFKTEIRLRVQDGLGACVPQVEQEVLAFAGC